MPTKKADKEEVTKEVNEGENIVTEVDYKAENEKLQKQLSELSKKFEILMNEKVEKEQKVEKEDAEDSSSDISIAPTKMINVTNLFYGELYLAGVNKMIKFPKFGVTRPMTFEDISHAQSVARSFAEEGYFYIHDKDAVKLLYLEDFYKTFIKKDKIKNILKLADRDLEDLIKNTTPVIKQTIADMIIDGLVKDENLEFVNKKFTDRNKIVLIGKLLDKDLFAEARKILDTNM